MPIFNIIFLPVILFIGIITAYQDFRWSRIRNKWILCGIFYSALIYILSWVFFGLAAKGVVGPEIEKLSFLLIYNFDKWCINLAISLLAAYLLWYFDLWSAGDAKLFICYSALTPIGQYHKVFFNYYFASFLLLLWIFIPATVFLFLKSIIYFIRNFNAVEFKGTYLKWRKENANRIGLIKSAKVALGFFVMFFLLEVVRVKVRPFLGVFLPGQIILALLFLPFSQVLSKFFKTNNRLMVYSAIFLILYFVFNMFCFQADYLKEAARAMKMMVSVAILLPIFKIVLDLYNQRTLNKTMPFAFWMFMGTLIAWFI